MTGTPLKPVKTYPVVSFVLAAGTFWLAPTFATDTASSRLVLGALVDDCRSALQIGVASCPEQPVDQSDEQRFAEMQVDRYLSDYGKPPREAVRALMDPTDANIAALVARQRQTLAVAAYVAGRMTEMQAQAAANRETRDLGPTLPLSVVLQVRATLYIRGVDDVTQRAVRALEQVTGRYPTIEAQLVYLGTPTQRPPRAWVNSLSTLLPISFSPAGDNVPDVPVLHVQDLRNGTSVQAPMGEPNARDMVQLIASLRLTPPVGAHDEPQ